MAGGDLDDVPQDLVGCMGFDEEDHQIVVVGAAQCLPLSVNSHFYVECALVSGGSGALILTGAKPALANIMKDQLIIASSILAYLDEFTEALANIGGETLNEEESKSKVVSLLVNGSINSTTTSRGQQESGYDLHVNYSPNNPGNEVLATVAMLVSLVALVTGKEPVPRMAYLSDCDLKGTLASGMSEGGAHILECCRTQGVDKLVVSKVSFPDDLSMHTTPGGCIIIVVMVVVEVIAAGGDGVVCLVPPVSLAGHLLLLEQATGINIKRQ